MFDLKAIGIGAAACVVVSIGAFYSGKWIGLAQGEAKCKERLLEIAAAAIEEKESDDAAQADAGLEDRRAVESEIARLRRILEERSRDDVKDGRTCIELGDAARLRDDFNAVFEKRLPSGRELDGE